MFLGLPGLARFAFARDDDVPDAEVVECVVDALLAVATIGGGGPWLVAGALDDPVDRWRELRRARRVALLQAVIEDDAVLVVHDLGLVAELDRLTELALGDRPGVRVVQADPAGRSGRGGPGHPLPGLGRDPTGHVEQFGQVVDRPAQPASPPTRGCVLGSCCGQCLGLGLSAAQGPPGVRQELLSVAGCAFGQLGELTGDPLHGGLRLARMSRVPWNLGGGLLIVRPR